MAVGGIEYVFFMEVKRISGTLDLLRKELRFNLKEQEEFYNDLLEDYKNNPLLMSQSTTDDFVHMEETVFFQNWMLVLKELNDHQIKSYKSIKSQAQLCETSEEKAKFATDRINQIQQELQKNKWTYLLSIDTFNLVLNPDFIYDIFLQTFPELDGKLYKWQKEINPYQRRSEASIVRKYQEIVQEDFFAEFSKLLKILSEAKLLQILKRELQDKQQAPSVPNYYPLVFKNKACHDLFLHCMEAYPKSDITKTLLSKYFEFFKNDEFILDKVKRKNFFKFVKNELEINMTRIESYASSDESEKQEYESTKNSFFQ